MENFWRFLSINSLGGRFTASFFIMVILPLLVVIIILNLTIERDQKNAEKERLLATLLQTRAELSNVTEDIENISRDLQIAESVQQAFKVFFRNDSDLLDQAWFDAGNTIKSLLYASDFPVSNVSLLTKETMVYQHVYQAMISCEKYYDEIVGLGGRPLWIHDTETEESISVFRRVNDLFSMQVIGIVELRIHEADLAAVYQTANMVDGSVITVLDNKGSVISATDKKYLGTNLADRSFFHSLRNRQGNFEADGFFYCYYTLDNPQWYILQMIPMRSFNRPFSTVNYVFGASLILLVLFALIFRITQNRMIIKPIATLADEVALLKIGQKPDMELRRGSEEIARLYKAMIEMSSKIRNLVENEHSLQLKQKEMEIACLEAQINPHFLYNTLDTIRWLAVLNDQKEIAGQIENLTVIFRHILNRGNPMTTVRQEAEHVKSYLEIIRFRYGEKLKYSLSIEDKALSCETPHLILQPLVENAVIHGISPQISGGTISVRVSVQNGILLYEVEDNGAGADEEDINRIIRNPSSGEGVFALKNIYNRLRLKYGTDYKFAFSSSRGKGTRVTINMPAREAVDET
ncbi:MAG: sensor histidine kinase [Treponema sp.]|jgi:two-component system sensor histidine kinase YesM|nr:sensor histidine kinase [Treponema sp.]